MLETETDVASKEQAGTTPLVTPQEPAPEVKPQAQTDGAETFFDPKQVPPELEPAYKQMQAAFTQKTQAIAESTKKAAAFDQLAASPVFREWYYAQTNPQPKKEVQEDKPLTFTEEQAAEIASDPRKMLGAIEAIVQDKLKRTVLPVAEQARMDTEVLKHQREIETFAGEFPDFWELDKQGLIDPLIARYPNLSVEDIYKLAKFSTLQQEATRKAHGIVQGKKAAVVEKPGLNSLPGTGKQKFRSREEAMTAIFEEALAGRSIPEIEIEKR